MNEDRDDTLIDACLDEILGGRTPPDLTERILHALAAHSTGDGQWRDDALVPPVPVLAGELDEPEPPPVQSGPFTVVRPHPAVSRRPPVIRWALLSLAATAAALLIATTLLVPRRLPVAKSVPQPGEPAVADHRPQPDNARAVDRDRPRLPPVVVRPKGAPITIPSSHGSPAPQVAVQGAPQQPAPPAAPERYVHPSPDAEVVSFVNAELARTWNEAGVKPSPPATDAEWCRRLFLRILGRIPHADDELAPFLADKSPDKRRRLVDRLLTDDKYVDEYARHWSAVWSNILIGRTGGRGGSLARRAGLEEYLRAALAANQPYREIIHDLLTATGSREPDAADYNPAVNFLLDGLDRDATLATARVSRVFLGQQLQCAQCHTHPSRDWSQEQYWALNSFFRQMQVERKSGSVRLVNADFPGQGRDSQGGEVYYETPAGLLKTAYPRFIDGTPIPASGQLAAVDRRQELARLVVQSDLLSKALVNRVWAHFFGYGFTQPVDDMGTSVSSPAAAVLDRLAVEFEARDYDLRSVLRWAALSDPFARSSKLTDLASRDMPEAGEVALFSRYYSRPMQAEEVYNSLVQAAQIRRSGGSEAEIEQARVDWLAQFSRNMRTDDAMEETHLGGMRQSLIMMNGALMRRAVSSQQGGLLRSVAASSLKFDKKVEHLFLAALSRAPTRAELQVATRILASSKGNETLALEDVWWAILNSNEFVLDH